MSDAPPPIPPVLPPTSPSKNRTPLYLLIGLVGLIVLGLLGFGAVRLVQNVISQQHEKKVAMQELGAFQKENQAHLREVVEGKDSVVGSAETLEEAQKKLGSIAGKLSASDRIVVEAAQDVMKVIQPILKEYQDAYAELQSVNSFSAVGLKTKQDLAKRRVVIQRFADANQRLTEGYRQIGEQFTAQLKTRGASKTASEAATRGFLKSANVEVVAEIREDDRQLGLRMFEVLDFYEKTWGKWETNPAGEIVFQKNDDLSRYQELMSSIQALADHQAQAQRKMLPK